MWGQGSARQYVRVIVRMHRRQTAWVLHATASIAQPWKPTLIMDLSLSASPMPRRHPLDGAGAQMALFFIVEDRRYAVRLADVLEVTPAAELTSPSGIGSTLIGYLDLRGEVIAVFGLRELMDLPARGLRLSDRFLVVRTAGRHAAIVVDRVEGVGEIEDSPPIAVSGPGRRDGLTLRRRPGAAEGEAVVAMLDLDRLLADLAVDQTEGAAS